MKKYKHAFAVFVLTILSTIGLYALFRFFLFRFPTQASAEAVVIDNFADIHFWLQAFLFALIMVIMLYAVFAFRRQPDDESEGPHVHGHTGLEIIWTIVPTAVVIGFAIYSVGILNSLLAPEQGERTIEVVGRQWSWKFVYPDIDDKSGTELGLLVNEPVVLHMWAEDVIHSFWVPEFRVKQDLLPVQNSETDFYVLRFTPTEEGEFKLRCAEICGLQHSQMFATVRVMNQTDYDAWAAEIASKPGLDELEGMTAEERGQFWYTEFGCNGCHSLDGAAMAGPTWLNLYGKEEQLADGSTVLVDDAYLYESILNPNAKITAGYNPGIMPQNFEDQFNNFGWGNADQITNDLIAFIRTVTDDTTASSR